MLILQTEEEKLQEQLFIITGIFGGVALILCLMILVLSFTLSKLSKEVREVRRKARSGAQPAGRERYASEPGPEMRPPGFSSKRDELPLEPVHPQRSESRYPDYQEREQPGGKSYNYRGEDRTDRTNDRSSQYSWEPLPRSSRAGEDSRGPRYSYRR